MEGWLVAVLVLLALAALAAGAYYLWARRRREQLRETFGPEYERAVEDRGDVRAAERELEERRARVDELDIRPLPPERIERYAAEWEAVQSRFVDDPSGALADADRLVQRVMSDRGYPMDEFDHRVADISVDHPDVAENFRAAHDVHERNERGDADTEDLRRAMVHYRALFAELLEPERVEEEVR